MKDTWFMDIENTVFTKIKKDCFDTLKTTYPNIKFTTSNMNQITNFPTVYIHMMQSDTFTDLDGKVIGINGCSFQIEVYSDKSQDVAKKVMSKVLESTSKLGFKPQIPSFNNMSTVYRQTATIRRDIGASETI